MIVFFYSCVVEYLENSNTNHKGCIQKLNVNIFVPKSFKTLFFNISLNKKHSEMFYYKQTNYFSLYISYFVVILCSENLVLATRN